MILAGLLLTLSAIDIEAKADRLLTAYNFSGSVLIARDGKPLFHKSYGMANHDWSIPNTTNTRFRIASISKQFAAASILKLEEAGRLKTSDFACKFISGCPEAWRSITIHQLLTHTSGIPSFNDYIPYLNLIGMPPDLNRNISLVPAKLRFPPGSAYLYSNTGYVLLTQIVELASGQPWQKFLSENIFQPAGMTNTLLDDPTAILLNRANGYVATDDVPRLARYMDMRHFGLAAGLLSTTGDLHRWDRALASNKILSRDSLKKMFTPDKENYGYGLLIFSSEGETLHAHGGMGDGFSAQFSRIPDSGIAIVILSNFENLKMAAINSGLTAIARGRDAVLPKPRKQIELAVHDLDSLLGRYQLSPKSILTITREGHQLFAETTFTPRFRLYAQTKDLLFSKFIEATLRVHRQDGIVTALTLIQENSSVRAAKLRL
jgi:CubicO group peptidase (beta-lactamase class C family)